MNTKKLPFPQTQTSSFPGPPAAKIRNQVRRAQSAAVPSPLMHQPGKENVHCNYDIKETIQYQSLRKK